MVAADCGVIEDEVGVFGAPNACTEAGEFGDGACNGAFDDFDPDFAGAEFDGGGAGGCRECRVGRGRGGDKCHIANVARFSWGASEKCVWWDAPWVSPGFWGKTRAF